MMSGHFGQGVSGFSSSGGLGSNSMLVTDFAPWRMLVP
jgi:hypothetical protein